MPARGAALWLASVGLDLARRFRAALAPLGLEPRQFAVLRHIVWKEDQTQQMLCDQLGISKSQMVALVDHLEARGLVERQLYPEDRRVRLLCLTPAGSKLLVRALKVAASHEARLRVALSDEEHSQLVSMLRRLTAEAPPADIPPRFGIE